MIKQKIGNENINTENVTRECLNGKNGQVLSCHFELKIWNVLTLYYRFTDNWESLSDSKTSKNPIWITIANG